MKKIYIINLLFLLVGCTNTGQIISGQLISNNLTKDLTGKTIILNDDCSPKKIVLNIPYCGNSNISKNELCTTTPDQKQYGYKILQVLNKKDALICTTNGYGNCYDDVEYVKNLGMEYEELIDNARIEGNILLKKSPYSYETALGRKTIKGYELITNAKFNKIKYLANNTKKCPKKEYSYSKDILKSNKNWIED